MIVRAAVFYDGTLEPPRRNADIVIEDGVVREVRDASGQCDREAACITPGMINVHAHVEMSGEPDAFAAIASTTPMQRLLRAASNARKALRAGVTSIRDLGSSDNIAREIRDAVNAGTIEGPRMIVAGRVLCMTGGHGWPFGRTVDSPGDGHRAVRQERHEGSDCIKMIATGGVLTKGAVPGLSQLTLDEMRAICDEAHRHGMRVAAHAIGTLGINDAIRAGVDSIEHGMLLDDESIDLFIERGVYLVPTLSAPTCINSHAADGGQPDFVVRKSREITERMAENVRRAFKAGVKFAGGSDAGTPFNYHDAYADEVWLMHEIVGMTPQQALHAATQSAGELIGTGTGTLRAGDPADLLLLQTDIDRDLRALREPLAVYKGGALV